MNRELPHVDLTGAVQKLEGLDEWDIVLEFIRSERDRCFSDLGPSENPHDVMKQAGRIAALQELLEILS